MSKIRKADKVEWIKFELKMSLKFFTNFLRL